MDTPIFERWIENSRECDQAVEAADKNLKDEAVSKLLSAERYAHNEDYSERHQAFELAKAYVEYKFGRSYQELQLEIYGEVFENGKTSQPSKSL